jgi:hypothetical protein
MDREPGPERHIKARGTYQDIYRMFHTVTGDDTMLRDFFDTLEMELGFVLGLDTF